MEQQNAIDRAVTAAGSQSELARKLGITPQAVQAWVARGYAPLGKIKDVARETGVEVADLLMDIKDAVVEGEGGAPD